MAFQDNSLERILWRIIARFWFQELVGSLQRGAISELTLTQDLGAN